MAVKNPREPHQILGAYAQHLKTALRLHGELLDLSQSLSRSHTPAARRTLIRRMAGKTQTFVKTALAADRLRKRSTSVIRELRNALGRTSEPSAAQKKVIQALSRLGIEELHPHAKRLVKTAKAMISELGLKGRGPFGNHFDGMLDSHDRFERAHAQVRSVLSRTFSER